LEPERESVRLHPELLPASGVLTASPEAAQHVRAFSSDRRRWFRAALYAGAIGLVLSFLPTGPLLALPAAGFVAVWFYTRMAGFPLRASEGFRLGALSGFFVSAVFTLLSLVAASTGTGRGEFRQAMIEAANRAHSMNPNVDPEQFVNFITTPAGMIFAILFTSVVLVLLGGMGGLLSAFISGRRLPR
jgi:hypothetical protein